MENIRGTQLLQRTFKVIELLSNHPKGLKLSEISKETDIPISTVHRILSFLNQNDYVRNEKNSGFYYIGPRFTLFSSVFLKEFDFLKEIRPGIERLNKEFDETVHVGILNSKHTKVLYIDKIESSRIVRMFSEVGQAVPIHCTGLGKSLFATLQDREIESILSHYNLKKFTETTITNKIDFIEEIENIRALGYAIDNKEHESNIICFGKSFYNSIDNIYLSVSLAIPVYRFKEKDRNNIIESLNNAVEWFESKLALNPTTTY